jgi:hypothetical protein
LIRQAAETLMPIRLRTRLLASLCLLLAGVATAAPRILVVEGVNPYRMLLPILGAAAVTAAAWEDGYLERSPLAAALLRTSGGEVRRIAWSGVPTDQTGLRAAVDGLKAELAAAEAEARPVWLLTHSLGSVIAYLALAEGGGRTVESFVSLAAPFGRPPILQWLAQVHPGLPLATLAAGMQGPAGLGIGRWVNVYTIWDPLAGPIRAEGVENRALRPLPSGPLPTLADLNLAHTLPFRDVGVAGLIVPGDASPAPPTGR